MEITDYGITYGALAFGLFACIIGLAGAVAPRKWEGFKYFCFFTFGNSTTAFCGCMLVLMHNAGI